MEKELKIEKYVKAYHAAMNIASSEIVFVMNEIEKHSAIPGPYNYNDFPGDGLGFYPEELQNQACPTYKTSYQIIQAIKEGVTLDKDWWETDRFL
jgi:hypothetical protein